MVIPGLVSEACWEMGSPLCFLEGHQGPCRAPRGHDEGPSFGHPSCWNVMGEGGSRRVTRQRPSLLCRWLGSELGQRQGRRVTKSGLVCTSPSSWVRIRPQRAVRLLLSNTDRLFAGHVVRGGLSSSPLPE